MSASPATIGAGSSTTSRRLPKVAIVVTIGSLIAAIVLSYVATNMWTSIQQHRLETRFDAAAAEWQTMDPVVRSDVTFSPGDPVARLTISSIGVDAIVVEGAEPGVMRRGPGHLIGSATPGDDGVAIITANRFAFGGFFQRLDRLDVGDRIVTQSPFGRTTYTVTQVEVVAADELDLATDSTVRQLMLFAGNRLWGGSDRLVVRAQADREMQP